MTTSPLLSRGPFVTDGGLETDLIFHHGVDLPEFAAFPLLDAEHGRDLLREYYDGYAGVARKAGKALLLETPTWRANPDWAAKVGYDAEALDRVNQAAVEFVGVQAAKYADVAAVLLVGAMGPRGDGYVAGDLPDPDEAAEYHSAQIGSFAAAGADLVSAITITGPQEAIGVVARPAPPAYRWRSPSRSRPTAGCRTVRRWASRSRPSTPRAGPTGSSSTAPTRPTSPRPSTAAPGSPGSPASARTPPP